MPARYDQDTKDDHGKKTTAGCRTAPAGLCGAAWNGSCIPRPGCSAAPSPDEHSRCHPGRRTPPGADHRRRGQRRSARRGPLLPGRLTARRPGTGRAARRAHPGPGHRAPSLGSPRDQLPEHGPEPGHHASRPGRPAQRLARQPEPATGGEDDLGPESFQLVSGWLARMPGSASEVGQRPLNAQAAEVRPSSPQTRRPDQPISPGPQIRSGHLAGATPPYAPESAP